MSFHVTQRGIMPTRWNPFSGIRHSRDEGRWPVHHAAPACPYEHAGRRPTVPCYSDAFKTGDHCLRKKTVSEDRELDLTFFEKNSDFSFPLTI
jgi:hypothetical protein